MEKFIEYEAVKERKKQLEEKLRRLETERESIFEKYFSNDMKYGDRVLSSPKDSTMADYVIELEQKNIDEKIRKIRGAIEYHSLHLERLESELKSGSALDRVYLCRNVHRMRMKDISLTLGYSIRTLYRMIKSIDKKINTSQHKNNM